jgi:hypothetical protein
MIAIDVPFSSGYYLRQFAAEAANPEMYLSPKYRASGKRVLFELDKVIQEAATAKISSLAIRGLQSSGEEETVTSTLYVDDWSLTNQGGLILRRLFKGIFDFLSARDSVGQSEALREYWGEARRDDIAKVGPLVASFLAVYDVSLALGVSEFNSLRGLIRVIIFLLWLLVSFQLTTDSFLL